MDRLIEQHLEEYLRGTLEPAKRAELEKRLAASDDYTRTTLASFTEHSQALRTLRAPTELEPAPGFYARVMQRIDSQRVTAWWGAFLEPAFSRRLAIASLALLILFGVTMYNTPDTDEVAAAASNQPAEVLALPAADDTVMDADQAQAQGRDVILVDLATYQE